jgi:cell wall-associated NlpC family hydrolase
LCDARPDRPGIRSIASMERGRRRTALARTSVAAVAAMLAAGGVAGCGGGGKDDSSKQAGVKREQPNLVAVARPDDAEAGDASPLPEGEKRGPAAPKPTTAGDRNKRRAEAAKPSEADAGISPGAPTDAEIRAELGEMKQVQKQAEKDALKAGPSGPLELTPGGNAKTPANAPAAVAAIIGSANAIARFPYVYGGGHGSFVDTAYDCSGSVSYALAGAGLLDAPLTSGDLAKWGDPGPGRWVTIFANAGHVFMYVAGTRYDTSGRSGVFGTRWNANLRGTGGFTVRHPPGL